MKNLSLLLSVIISLSSMAHADDLVSEKSDLFIKITINESNLRCFSLASKTKGEVLQLGALPGSNQQRCFSVEQLENQRNWEIAKLTGSSVASLAAIVVVGVGLYFTGGWTAVAAAEGAADGAFGVGVSTGVLGAGGTGGLIITSDLSPVELAKRQYLLRNEMINDGLAHYDSATDVEMNEIAMRLDEVLKRIL